MSFEVDVGVIHIRTWFANVDNNPQIKLAVHNALAKEVNPYVPMKTGVLSQTPIITADGVRYIQPYAHYQYTGIVYGPNFPVIEDGIIVGWRSPAGRGSKHPTGRPIQYSTELHPLATHHWEQAMMRDRGDEFKKQVKDIIRFYLRRSV